MSVLPLRRGEPQAPPLPRDIEDRIRRGRREMRKDFYRRRLCALFLRGEAYSYLTDKGALHFQATEEGAGTGRPRHRVRNKYNMIQPMVDAKVSSSTTRIPGYEVNPSSTDPEDDAAARLSQKLMRQGYEKWHLREARVSAVTTAIGCGGSAYALPYFDPMVGPFRKVPGDPMLGTPDTLVGEGEIKVLNLNGNQVFWEPGVEFYHSRWYGVEVARPIAEVRRMPGFFGGELTADASTKDTPLDAPDEGMCIVTLYFERPCPEYPQGRMLTSVGGRQVVPGALYPLRHQGTVLDEPCIHRLVYRLDPENDNDLGLTWQLIDFQRTYQDAMNKSVELKSHALLPQIMAPRGSIKKAPSDMPGEIIYYDPVGGQAPQWRPPPDPSILAQLQQIIERCMNDMRFVAADTDVDVAPNVAIGTVQAVIQQAANRWSQFVTALAEWDSKVARHCLLLAQEHYDEERILKVRGRFGWEPEASFRGADIMGQVDVTVLPASIETRSRQSMLQTLGWIQANFPGYVRPEVAIDVALNGDSLDGILQDFEQDKARMNDIIQKVRDGSIMDMPSRMEMVPSPPDPLTGAPLPAQLMSVPGWMPRRWDNAEVQMATLTSWMKSQDFTALPADRQEAAVLIFEGFEQLQAQQAAQQQAAQMAQAMDLGASNAARPQEKGQPSTPSPAGPSQ